MSLTFDRQIRLNNIIYRLVSLDGETYDVDDGRELRNIVFADCALTPHATIYFVHTKVFPTTHVSGYAAGIGNISLSEQERTKTFKLGCGGEIYCGNWVLSAWPTCISIDHRFNDTRRPENRESYYLVLDKNMEPVQLRKDKITTFSLFGIKRIVFSRPVTMKLPVQSNHLEPCA